MFDSEVKIKPQSKKWKIAAESGNLSFVAENFDMTVIVT